MPGPVQSGSSPVHSGPALIRLAGPVEPVEPQGRTDDRQPGAQKKNHDNHIGKKMYTKRTMFHLTKMTDFLENWEKEKCFPEQPEQNLNLKNLQKLYKHQTPILAEF